MSFQEEAILRNKVLGDLYGRLPGYALFDDLFISQQSLKSRIEWFKSFNTEEYLCRMGTEILSEVGEMIVNLEKESLQIESK